jgi:hypothetical protein
MKPIYLNLTHCRSWRSNTPLEPSPWRDVGEIIGGALVLLLWGWIFLML